MNGVSQSVLASSANAVNQILEMASTAELKQAEKLMKLAVTMTVGREAGKGQNLDVSG
jgi:hypothetical protein